MGRQEVATQPQVPVQKREDKGVHFHMAHPKPMSITLTAAAAMNVRPGSILCFIPQIIENFPFQKLIICLEAY